MKFFVTGADGYIGSHVVEALLARGHAVVALAQYNSFGSAGWLDGIESSPSLQIEWGDVRDPQHMVALCDGVDTVIHLAALITIPYSYVAPRSYLETNVLGTHNVLEASRLSKVGRFIQISTSEVYGSAQSIPITESHPLVAQSPYSASKIAADQLANSYWSSFGTPVVTVRPFNTYGPRQSNRAVIPSIISQLFEHPDFLELGIVNTTRDLTFVEDTASGVVAAALGSGGEGEVFNLGTGDEWSVQEIVDEISQLLKLDPKIRQVEERLRPVQSEVMRLVSDNSRVTEQFGWSPIYVRREGLQSGLRATISWFRENLHRYPNSSRLLL